MNEMDFMNKIIFCLLLLLPGYLEAFNSHGAAMGKIDKVAIKETGNVFIRFEQPHDNTMGCDVNNEVVINYNKPNRDIFYSNAISAFVSNLDAGFWVVECFTQYGKSYPVASTAMVYK